MIPFNPVIFFVAFCVGMLYNYLYQPEPKIIKRYPTPLTAHKFTYTDQAGNRYRYRVQLKACPLDKTAIREIPIYPEPIEPYTVI